MALSATHNKTTFSVGDAVKVHHKLFEAGKMRTAPFEGTVISIKGEGEKKMFTVRRIGAAKIGIERIFPLSSPWIEKVEVSQKAGKGTRRAKLYYLREKARKEQEKIARRASRRKRGKKTKEKKQAKKKK